MITEKSESVSVSVEDKHASKCWGCVLWFESGTL